MVAGISEEEGCGQPSAASHRETQRNSKRLGQTQRDSERLGETHLDTIHGG